MHVLQPNAIDTVFHLLVIVVYSVFRSRDFYHTCYCLSGLSVAQHFGNVALHHQMILGREENRLVRLWPASFIYKLWRGNKELDVSPVKKSV